MSILRIVTPKHDLTDCMLDNDLKGILSLPHDPDELNRATRWLNDIGKKIVYGWVDKWLRDPQNDCLRARGDARWHVMCQIHNLAQ